MSAILSDGINIGTFRVGRVGFGAMRLAGPNSWGPPTDRPAALRLVRAVIDEGVTFIDTADSYGGGASEEALAEALWPYPEGLLIGTKAGQSRPSPTEWVPLGRPEYLRQQVELSLLRLRVDRLDHFQLHRIDPKVPTEEQFGVLADLVREGKIRHVGLSKVNVAQIEMAQEYFQVVSVQNKFSVADQRQAQVLAYCEQNDIAFIAWHPMSEGGLAASDGIVAEVAEELGAAPAAVALAWLLQRSPALLPIPGTTSVEHLRENMSALELELSDTQFARLSTEGRSR